jgi:hypothetical protein
LPRAFHFSSELVVFGTEKVEILQYYLMPCRAFEDFFCLVSGNKEVFPPPPPLHLPLRKTRPFASAFSCHGLSIFSGISCLWHRKSRNTTVLSHEYWALHCPFVNGKVEISQYYLTACRASVCPFANGKVEIPQYYLTAHKQKFNTRWLCTPLHDRNLIL